MSNKFKWGIIGLGNIATRFAEDLSFIDNASVYAVASRSSQKAKGFGAKFGAEQCFGDYDSFINDADIDAVYIALPHPMHHEFTLRLLDRGVPVLCEKPIAMNAIQAKQMFDKAKQKNTFLMEAMWMRHFPLMHELRNLLKKGSLGDIQTLRASFGFRAEFNPPSRLFDPALGGGALLDVGIYPLSAASMILGKPNRISSMANIGKTDVDEENSIILGYKNGAIATLCSSIQSLHSSDLFIRGTNGSIRVEGQFWQPRKMEIEIDGKTQIKEFNVEGIGYHYEASAMMECISKGQVQCDVMPWAESISIMETIDQIKNQWGLVYPCE